MSAVARPYSANSGGYPHCGIEQECVVLMA